MLIVLSVGLLFALVRRLCVKCLYLACKLLGLVHLHSKYIEYRQRRAKLHKLAEQARRLTQLPAPPARGLRLGVAAVVPAFKLKRTKSHLT